MALEEVVKNIEAPRLLALIDSETQRLGWTTQMRREHLISNYGKRSRLLLTREQLCDFLKHLQSLHHNNMNNNWNELTVSIPVTLFDHIENYLERQVQGKDGEAARLLTMLEDLEIDRTCREYLNQSVGEVPETKQ